MTSPPPAHDEDSVSALPGPSGFHAGTDSQEQEFSEFCAGADPRASLCSRAAPRASSCSRVDPHPSTHSEDGFLRALAAAPRPRLSAALCARLPLDLADASHASGVVELATPPVAGDVVGGRYR